MLHDTPYDGPQAETIRIWGRDRLPVLARLLPLADGADVYLLGTGLPSFWSVRMGEMRLMLGLSGWTANDWTSGGGAWSTCAAAGRAERRTCSATSPPAFRESPALTFEQVRQRTGAAPRLVAAGLNRLALLGQVIHDLPAGRLPLAADPAGGGVAQAGEGRQPGGRGGARAGRGRRVEVTRDETAGGLRALVGRVDGNERSRSSATRTAR